MAFEIAPGAAVRIQPAKIASVANPTPPPPPEVLKKIARLVAQLGAERAQHLSRTGIVALGRRDAA